MERLRILDRDSFLEDGLKGAADNLLLDVGFMGPLRAILLL